MKDDAVEVLSIEGREVRVTYLDNPYFSQQTKLSKLDLVRYHLSVAPGALASVRDRPLVLNRLLKKAHLLRCARSPRYNVSVNTPPLVDFLARLASGPF